MKKILSLITCITLLAVLTGGVINSASADTYITKILTGERGASLRSTPEKTSGNKIGSIHANVYLDVEDESNGWFFVYYGGQYGWVSSDPGITTIVETSSTGTIGSVPDNRSIKAQRTVDYSAYDSDEPYDMGIPYIGNTVYKLNMMNMTVFWVQTQLKATGVWYQGYQWDVTGNLGDHTMAEIRSFMQTRGYRSHTGVVDQNVIDELADYLGSRLEPVYIGGFYESMNSIMVGGSGGSMYQITSNLRDMVARETIGARWVQCVLKGLGYYTGPIDGMYGEGTENAVMRFQRENGFQERDYVTLGVARAMLEQYYYRGYSLSNLP